MSCASVCPTAYSPIRYCGICQTYVADVEPIKCIDCGCIIAQYEHYIDNGIEGYGHRDTIERIGSADSLRCGRCYRRANGL